MNPAAPLSPRRAVALIALVQFVYVLDFMMVLPLGADLSRALGFSAERLGWLAAAYTLASLAAGALAARRLDRFNRKSALLACFGALSLATLASSWAENLAGLLAGRALTGACGGLAVAVAMAIIADTVPPERRGQAIGRVMIGFSLAAIAGVPVALELSRLGGWTLPFQVVAGLGTLVWIGLWIGLPPLHAHRQAGSGSSVSLRELLSRPAIRRLCLVQAACQGSAFLVIPSYAAFFLFNLGYPRPQLGLLYLAGGLAALLAMQLLGRLSDRLGAAVAVTLATAVFVVGLTPLLGLQTGLLFLPFLCLMAGNAGRNVSLSAFGSQLPAPAERAGFMALVSMVQDVAIVAAALLSTLLLAEGPDGRLIGAQSLALWSLALALLGALGFAWRPRRRLAAETR